MGESNRKYTVPPGTKVRIKQGLVTSEPSKYYGLNFCSEMKQYEGKEATITGYTRSDWNRIDLDDGKFHWNTAMFDVIDIEPSNGTKVKIVFRKGKRIVVRGDET